MQNSPGAHVDVSTWFRLFEPSTATSDPSLDALERRNKQSSEARELRFQDHDGNEVMVQHLSTLDNSMAHVFIASVSCLSGDDVFVVKAFDPRVSFRLREQCSLPLDSSGLSIFTPANATRMLRYICSGQFDQLRHEILRPLSSLPDWCAGLASELPRNENGREWLVGNLYQKIFTDKDCLRRLVQSGVMDTPTEEEREAFSGSQAILTTACNTVTPQRLSHLRRHFEFGAIVMERISGYPLNKVLDVSRLNEHERARVQPVDLQQLVPSTVDEACTLLRSANYLTLSLQLAGLNYTDYRPDNVMCTRSPSDGTLRLMWVHLGAFQPLQSKCFELGENFFPFTTETFLELFPDVADEALEDHLFEDLYLLTSSCCLSYSKTYAHRLRRHAYFIGNYEKTLAWRTIMESICFPSLETIDSMDTVVWLEVLRKSRDLTLHGSRPSSGLGSWVRVVVKLYRLLVARKLVLDHDEVLDEQNCILHFLRVVYIAGGLPSLRKFLPTANYSSSSSLATRSRPDPGYLHLSPISHPHMRQARPNSIDLMRTEDFTSRYNVEDRDSDSAEKIRATRRKGGECLDSFSLRPSSVLESGTSDREDSKLMLTFDPLSGSDTSISEPQFPSSSLWKSGLILAMTTTLPRDKYRRPPS
ncbi:hypothetical protein EDD37DRAFT_650712 [Exophiala viscosa]|uniref:uncharacterized protein n=1 Tax=Exophiala viscosa TaxID=2486360 RepID=UPI0021941BD8|nr:hypothetical protein EDD37DRAFT_650712 [Exophiala viscosa]